MVDLEVLDAYGVSAEKWKDIFSKPREKRPEKVNNLIDGFRRRLQSGRDQNLEFHLVYKGLDDAWDASMKQLSPTLLKTLIDKGNDGADVADILKSWDLDPRDVLVEVPDPKTPGKNIKKVSVPAFFKILVPLCAAYVKIRWAKIVNDVPADPFFKFSPAIDDEISRLKCEALTDRVDVMSQEYGYFDIWKQIVFRALHYAECLQFPVEQWHTEFQIVEKDSPYEGETIDGPGSKKFKKVVVKEGLRYHLPHPSRTYYDRAYFASTFNTDTGCSFAGYWRVLRWKDVVQNPDYYNKESIGCADFDKWFQGNRNHTYWVNILHGCALNFPGTESMPESTSEHDNEVSLVKFYNSTVEDAAIVVTEHYQKIRPKDYDLGEYEHEIWCRFVIAADNNILYATPLPSVPVMWYGYDWAEGRTHNASMTLECLPFQDQFSNLLSQILLTTKQNLANLSFVNTDVMDEKAITQIENLGERFWRSVNIIRASFRAMFKKGMNEPQRDVVLNYKFPYQDVTQLYMAMKTIIDTLERVLVMSSQEVGQAASHEQTRAEIRQITSQTSIRGAFTAQGLEPGRDAWKRQIYYSLMAYGQESFYAQVPMETELTPEQMSKLGFTFKAPWDEKNHKAYVSANKTALLYESFTNDRDGVDRIDDVEMAKGLMSEFTNLMSNPTMAQAIGADQAIKIVNYINRFLGFPRDFKLVNAQEQQPDQLMQQMQQALMQLKQYVDGAIQKSSQELQQDAQGAITELAKKNQQQDQALMQINQGVQQLIGMLHSTPTPMPPQPEELDTIQPTTPMELMQGVG